MYLSRLIFNPRSRQARQLAADPYQLHRAVMKGFPELLPAGERVLHRLETGRDTPVLLVQSALAPDWSTLDPAVLLPPDPFDPRPNPAVKPVELPLQAGQRLAFRLWANPTLKKVRRDENGERRNSNRAPLLREDEQVEWLRKRAGMGGFTVLGVTVGQTQEQKLWKKKGTPPITLVTVQFDGILRVDRPDALREAVLAGLGPAKAFGCGLLSLAPA